MEVLQKLINNLNENTSKRSVEHYNSLIKSCVERHEMTAVVYIYDVMRVQKVLPTEYTYQLIELLHSKTALENNSLRIKIQTSGKLQPRRRIHKIIKGYHYSKNYNASLRHLDIVKQYLTENPEIMLLGRIKLAKNISKYCSITFNEARYIITKLKRTKFLTKSHRRTSTGPKTPNATQTKITQFF